MTKVSEYTHRLRRAARIIAHGKDPEAIRMYALGLREARRPAMDVLEQLKPEDLPMLIHALRMIVVGNEPERPTLSLVKDA